MDAQEEKGTILPIPSKNETCRTLEENEKLEKCYKLFQKIMNEFVWTR